MSIGLADMMIRTEPRIVLRGREVGEENDVTVDHPGQPADYVHKDGTVWRHQDDQAYRNVDGVHLRVYDLLPEASLTD
jgi:hypothetical protein